MLIINENLDYLIAIWWVHENAVMEKHKTVSPLCSIHQGDMKDVKVMLEMSLQFYRPAVFLKGHFSTSTVSAYFGQSVSMNGFKAPLVLPESGES